MIVNELGGSEFTTIYDNLQRIGIIGENRGIFLNISRWKQKGMKTVLSYKDNRSLRIINNRLFQVKLLLSLWYVEQVDADSPRVISRSDVIHVGAVRICASCCGGSECRCEAFADTEDGHTDWRDGISEGEGIPVYFTSCGRFAVGGLFRVFIQRVGVQVHRIALFAF